MDKLRKNYYEIALALSMTLIILVLIMLFNSYSTLSGNELIEYSEKRLYENLIQQRHNIVDMFERESKAIEIIAQGLQGRSNEEVVEYLDKYFQKGGYAYIVIADLNGNGITNNGQFVNISFRDYFKTVIETEKTLISNPINTLMGDAPQAVAVATPVYDKNRRLAGVLAGCLDTRYLNSQLLSAFNNNGHDVVIENDGTIIVETSSCSIHGAFGGNLSDVYAAGKYIQQEGYQGSNEEIRNRINHDKEGRVKIVLSDGVEIISVYAPLGINSWYIFSIAPTENLGIFFSNTRSDYTQLSLACIGLLATLSCYIIFSRMRIGKKILAVLILAVIISSSTGVLGAFSLVSTYESYSEMLDNNYNTLYHLNGLSLNINNTIRAIRDIIIAEDKEDKEESLDQLNKLYSQILNDRETLLENAKTQREKELLEKYLQELLEGRKVLNDEIRLAMDGDTSGAMSFFLRYHIPKIENLEILVRELTTLNLTDAMNKNDNLKNKANYTILLVIVIIVASIIITVVLCLILARSISRPLSKIEKAAMKIADNDTGFELDVESNDEIGVVAKILNTSVRKAFIELSDKNQTITESLSYARKIQGNLLPKNDSFEKSFTDHNVLWMPRNMVGGDIYWLGNFEEGTLLCICDCTGHGTPGALLTMLVISALDNIVTKNNFHDTANIMYELDKKLAHILRGNNASEDLTLKDGVDICIIFKSISGDVTISSANILTFVCDGKKSEIIKSSRLFVGEGRILSKDEVKRVIIPYNKENKFYIASDGLFDQIGGIHNVPFGYSKFSNLILQNHNEKLSDTTDKILFAFNEHKGDELQRDDVMLISFKP